MSYKKRNVSLDDIDFLAYDVAITDRNGYVHCSKGCLSVVAKSEVDGAELGPKFRACEVTVSLSFGETNDCSLSTSFQACTIPLQFLISRIFWHSSTVPTSVVDGVTFFFVSFGT